MLLINNLIFVKFLMITGFCPNMTVDEIEKRQFFYISVPPSAQAFHIDAQLSSRDCVFHCRRISTKPEAIVMTGDPPATPRLHRQPRRPLNESSTASLAGRSTSLPPPALPAAPRVVCALHCIATLNKDCQSATLPRHTVTRR